MAEALYCFADTETGSELDLKTYGTPRYAEHPSTFVQLFSYSLYEGHMGLWDMYRKEPIPYDLKDVLANPNAIFVFWNAFFDRMVLKHAAKIDLPIRRTRCAMAQAMSHGLPGSLEKVGDIVGIREDAKKLREGKALVQFFCKPKKQRDGSLVWNRPWDYPEQWAKYCAYCKNDTLAMREIVKRLPTWNYAYNGGNPDELQYWFMDQEMNEHGMPIDLTLAEAAVRAVDKEQAVLRKKTQTMTQGEVEAASQRDVLLGHILREYGVELPNMQKATLERLVENDATPEPLRDLLQVRLSTCTTATAKYKRLLQVTSKDGRFRGGIKYYGAGRTGRDSGSNGFQVQNLAKPTIEHELIEDGIECLLTDTADIVGFDVMVLCSSAVRYSIAAPKGSKFCIADLSNIEGRIIAWLAGEDWKLQAFRDFDAGLGHDLYRIGYAKSFGISPDDVTKEQRNTVGKVQELALGFGGGVGGMLIFCTMYNIDLEDLAHKAIPNIPSNIYKDAVNFYEWLDTKDINAAKAKSKKEKDSEEYWKEYYQADSTKNLAKHVFCTLDSLKRLWRLGHPKITEFWKGADTACRNAVNVPNRSFWFGKCYARRTGKWVGIILPSGHTLCYPGMAIESESDSLYFWGVNQYTRKWEKIYTTPGKLSENCTQALALDVFKYGRLRAEQQGYPCVLPLHDEIVAEVPDTSDYSYRQLETIMATVPPWAEGLPLAAKGFEDYRYHKSLD